MSRASSSFLKEKEKKNKIPIKSENKRKENKNCPCPEHLITLSKKEILYRVYIKELNEVPSTKVSILCILDCWFILH